MRCRAFHLLLIGTLIASLAAPRLAARADSNDNRWSGQFVAIGSLLPGAGCPSPPGCWEWNVVSALALDGSGNLYASGGANGTVPPAPNPVAKWGGSFWSALGGINIGAGALALDGSGNLYAGGTFTRLGDASDAGGAAAAGGISANNVARWDGSAWSALGSGVDSSVNALATDGSGNLYAGGSFTTAGGISANHVAKWDGSTWSALGSGINNVVTALALDGRGNLYAADSASTLGNHVARWDGRSWSVLDSVLEGPIAALAADGIGNLYAGGGFGYAGPYLVHNVARWDGSDWSAMGSGVDTYVNALAADSSGNLYAGGLFTTAGGVSANYVAKWDGNAWSPLGSGINSGVDALLVDGSGNLYAGGGFTTAGNKTSYRVGMYSVPARTTTTTASSANPSAFGQSVTFTARVTFPQADMLSTPTGMVTFKDGISTLGTGALSFGAATFVTSTLSVGSHGISAVYGGDSNFNTSGSSPMTQTVNTAATTTTLASSPNPAALGQSVAFTATVTSTAGIPTGSVTFNDGPTALGTDFLWPGPASFVTSTLSVGSHSISAVYGGDSNFNTSASTVLTQTVVAAGLRPRAYLPLVTRAFSGAW
ncbi:MAG: Ig-like domain repeat protein [Dehalococcoidia bacterium]|nr:Ig-like domain repeat protein [Dehalococcoidia bacterium]